MLILKLINLTDKLTNWINASLFTLGFSSGSLILITSATTSFFGNDGYMSDMPRLKFFLLLFTVSLFSLLIKFFRVFNIQFTYHWHVNAFNSLLILTFCKGPNPLYYQFHFWWAFLCLRLMLILLAEYIKSHPCMPYLPAWSTWPRAQVPKACQLFIFTCQRTNKRANASTCQRHANFSTWRAKRGVIKHTLCKLISKLF